MTTDLARIDDEHQSRAIGQADPEQAAGALAHILATGDLSKLSNEQRISHYLDLCHSLSLNPRSRPFDWLLLDGKLVLYPNKSCAEQLRRQHQISVKVTRREIVGELFVVEVEGRTPTGRTDEASKYVPITFYDRNAGQQKRLTGDKLGSAFAKAETGAKRRLVLSMVGLASPPDPEEVKGARVVVVDGTGRVIDNPTPEQRYLAETPAAAAAIGEPIFETVGDAATAPLAGTAGQRVRADELERPARPARPAGPPATFRCDKAKWSRHWAMVVQESYLDDDDARHRYVAAYTSSWPEAARTSSLSRLLDVVTDVQARDFIEYTRAHLAERARAEAADPDGELEGIDGLTPEQADDEAATQAGYDARPMSDDDLDAALEAAAMNRGARRRPPATMEDVHAAAQLTGAPARPVTRTALVAELRRLIKAVQAQGGSVDVPANLAGLSDAEVVEMSAGLQRALDEIEAPAEPEAAF